MRNGMIRGCVRLTCTLLFMLDLAAASASAENDWLVARQKAFAGWQKLHPDVAAQIADLKAKTSALVAAAGPPTSDIHAPPVIHRVSGAIGEIWDDPAAPQMVVIPAGSYTMGSPPSEAHRSADEGPQHRVNIGYAFALGKYPVTRGEWSQFVADTQRRVVEGCQAMVAPDKPWTVDPTRNWRNPGFNQTDDDPVVCVSYNDAQDYVAWLSKKTGRKYRLPSEAEWQYAARAGTTAAYYWGDIASHDEANYGEDEGDIGCGVAHPAQPCALAPKMTGRDRWLYTSPVGSFPPNPFGLYDMLGNAWQITEDCYQPAFAFPADGSPVVCARHSTLGGGWLFGIRTLRAAFRGKDTPDQRIYGDGFRVALTL